jgi:hypothetical protein
MVHFPTGLRILGSVVAPFRGKVHLPEYLPPDAIFTDKPQISLNPLSPIFITARFRSGSTLLWQIFQRLEGFTAYYEPLNERRWFNPKYRGNSVDESHRGTTDYAENYENLEFLNGVYRSDWISRRLAMGMAAKDPMMERYIQALIDAATARPVLQFNRVDFRLAFLRQYFPNATIVHVRRSPRDTWRSTLKGLANDPSWTLETFEPFSKFYLLPWYRDLALAFPWLICRYDKTHPYEIHYSFSRLSDLFASRYAHVFTSYEQVMLNFEGEVAKLLGLIGLGDVDLSVLEGLRAPRVEPYDHISDNQFYADIEMSVENKLKRVLEPA